MFKYFGKRILKFIPCVFAILLVGFWIGKLLPGDPVEKILVKKYGASLSNDLLQSKALKTKIHSNLGLDKPNFYFDINGYNECDTLYKISDLKEREFYILLSKEFSESNTTSNFFKLAVNQKDKGFKERLINSLSTLELETVFNHQLQETELKHIYSTLKDKSSSFHRFIPTIQFNGSNNQFHSWVFGNGENQKGILRGDFGVSWITGQPISSFIWKKLFISLEIIFLSTLLAYLLAIPLGFYLSRKPNKIITSSLFFIYSIPAFIGGTLLIYFFANANLFHIFPESGIYPTQHISEEHNYFSNLVMALPYMILPVLTLGYSLFSFLTTLVNQTATQEHSKLYFMSALAKGHSDSSANYKSVLKNIAVPLLTIFTQLLPAAIGGTLVIEIVFQYPGLGKTIYEAILSQDYPIISAAVTITGLFTLLAYFVADILYAIVDPRMKSK